MAGAHRDLVALGSSLQRIIEAPDAHTIGTLAALLDRLTAEFALVAPSHLAQAQAADNEFLNLLDGDIPTRALDAAEISLLAETIAGAAKI